MRYGRGVWWNRYDRRAMTCRASQVLLSHTDAFSCPVTESHFLMEKSRMGLSLLYLVRYRWIQSLESIIIRELFCLPYWDHNVIMYCGLKVPSVRDLTLVSSSKVHSSFGFSFYGRHINTVILPASLLYFKNFHVT